MSTISGSTVSLYQAGNPPTLLATTTTNKDGTFNFTAPSSASGLLYLVVSGGNAGSGTNSNIQLMALAGTASSPTTALRVNELTSAATQLVTMNFGLLLDSNGNLTVNAAKNQTGASNAVTQYANLITPSTGAIVSGLATSLANGLNTMANAFASCVQNASGCTTLMSTSTSTSGSGAKSLLEAGFNMLSNSSTVASGVYTLAAALSSSTGFSIPATIPGGFTFNNALSASTNTFSIPNNPSDDGAGVAIDANGNVWAGNFAGNTVVELSSSGATLATYTVGTNPNAPSIDASGNVWVANQGSANVSGITPSGTVLGPFTVGSTPVSTAIDASGNIWVAVCGIGSVVELNSSGTLLNTFNAHIGCNVGVAIDASGNVWTDDQGGPAKIRKLSSSSGAIVGMFTEPGSAPLAIAFDTSGNAWFGNRNSTFVTEITSSGGLLGNFNVGGTNDPVAIDVSGNVWVPLKASASVLKIAAATNGPQFFPYSGPQFP